MLGLRGLRKIDSMDWKDFQSFAVETKANYTELFEYELPGTKVSRTVKNRGRKVQDELVLLIIGGMEHKEFPLPGQTVDKRSYLSVMRLLHDSNSKKLWDS